MQNVAEVFDDKSVVQEALENFAALLEDADFTAELELMGIGRMQFMRRRQMLVEWRGLYMALWRLALSSSFPQDAEHIFATFCMPTVLPIRTSSAPGSWSAPSSTGACFSPRATRISVMWPGIWALFPCRMKSRPAA